MKYEKEYQEFVKKITDKFITFVTGECPPQTWSGHSFCDDMYREPTDEEKDKFYKENNKFALQWLKENMVCYDEWIEKYKNS